MAIRLIRLFTGDDDQSQFSVGEIEWKETEALNAISQSEQARTISFEETSAGASLDWHNAPHRQYVVTLSGRLELETRRAQSKSSNQATSYLPRTLGAEGIAGAWSMINRGDASTSPCRKRDAAQKRDERPAEMLQGERFAML